MGKGKKRRAQADDRTWREDPGPETAFPMKERIELKAYGDLANLAASTFPLVPDFEIRLTDSEYFGAKVHFVSTSSGPLASFPWWDHADARLRTMALAEVPLGAVGAPFSDMEQGWNILIWQREDHVFVMEGDALLLHENVYPSSSFFDRWFRVPKEVYLSAWEGVLRAARARAGAFHSLEAALREPHLVRTLLLGNQGLTELPPEVCDLPHLESLDLYHNQLSTLPPAMGKLTKLRCLDLRFNRITALPDELSSLTALEAVSLGENRLEAIPEWVPSLPKLKRFSISDNPVDPASLERARRKRPHLDVG